MGKQTASFNRALSDIARIINSDVIASEKLQHLVTLAPRPLAVRGCSLLLLDEEKNKLIHVAVHGISERYLRKGFIEAEKSLSDTLEGNVVTVLDAATDPRIQFQELAKQEHIVSIMSVPVKIGGKTTGSLRVYSRTHREFTWNEQEYLTTVANLAGVVLDSARLVDEPKGTLQNEAVPTPRPTQITSPLKPQTFAHPSEEEFARLLDFYQIDWFYEPRSFPLQWENGRITEMFTPDFYLPRLDLYIEMTTLKPSLTSEKRKKVRRLRQVYPEVNIKLLSRDDYDRLLAKYGHGPLSGSKTRGAGRVLYSAAQIQTRVRQLAKDISDKYEGQHPLLVGVLRGVFFFMADLARYLTVPVDIDFMAISHYGAEKGRAVRVTKDLDINPEGRHVLLVEDIVDTGMTLSFVTGYLKSRNPASLSICTLLDKSVHRLANVQLDYVGFQVPDEFLVGYGLDYEEEYRNLPFVALLKEEKPEK